MNELGGLQVVVELLQVDYEMYKMIWDLLNLVLCCYVGMIFINFIFGDVVNKVILCVCWGCMEVIVVQLVLDSEEFYQVVFSIFWNLFWRVDINSKKVLREVGSVIVLVQCVLWVIKEFIFKSVLSVLWNLFVYSMENKVVICQVDGVLGFLVSILIYKCQSNLLVIIESGGGIFCNVFSFIVICEDYRQVFWDYNCLQMLLQYLILYSLMIVSNVCGIFWNLLVCSV